MIKPGTMLVSHPSMAEEPFAKSVILISENHRSGSIGFIVNKTSQIHFAQVMRERGSEWPYEDDLYMGGPVNSTALIALHSTEWYSSNTFQISDDFAISSDHLMTEKMSMGNTPMNYRLISGMSGWAPGQLETEISKKKWLAAPARSDIIFETTGEITWKKAIQHCATVATRQYL